VPGKLDSRNSVEKLLRRLCIKCEIYVPRLAACFFLAVRGNLSLNLAVLDFEIAHLDRTGCMRTPVRASAMISLISVEEIRGRDRSDLLSSIYFKRGGVVAHVRLRARLRNCDHVRLAQHPGERNLGGSRVMGLRDFL
jgi:hypothetical protein